MSAEGIGSMLVASGSLTRSANKSSSMHSIVLMAYSRTNSSDTLCHAHLSPFTSLVTMTTSEKTDALG
jgi:hypothetical protein